MLCQYALSCLFSGATFDMPGSGFKPVLMPLVREGTHQIYIFTGGFFGLSQRKETSHNQIRVGTIPGMQLFGLMICSLSTSLQYQSLILRQIALAQKLGAQDGTLVNKTKTCGPLLKVLTTPIFSEAAFHCPCQLHQLRARKLPTLLLT